MIVFFISLICCILIHEFGHLIAAKLCKCGVDVFSIGFYKPLFSFDFKGTTYNFTPILLGGYTKLEGELDGNNTSPTAFVNLPYRKKFLIAMAGCFMNCLTGLISFYIGRKFINPYLIYFGLFSIILGLSNALPIPALDGSYLFLVWLEKIYGKKKGYALMNKICKIGFIILMTLNIICLPYLIYLIRMGKL